MKLTDKKTQTPIYGNCEILKGDLIRNNNKFKVLLINKISKLNKLNILNKLNKSKKLQV